MEQSTSCTSIGELKYFLKTISRNFYIPFYLYKSFENHITIVMPEPSHSSCDLFLFPKLKKTPKGHFFLALMGSKLNCRPSSRRYSERLLWREWYKLWRRNKYFLRRFKFSVTSYHNFIFWINDIEINFGEILVYGLTELPFNPHQHFITTGNNTIHNVKHLLTTTRSFTTLQTSYVAQNNSIVHNSQTIFNSNKHHYRSIISG